MSSSRSPACLETRWSSSTSRAGRVVSPPVTHVPYPYRTRLTPGSAFPEVPGELHQDREDLEPSHDHETGEQEFRRRRQEGMVPRRTHVPEARPEVAHGRRDDGERCDQVEVLAHVGVDEGEEERRHHEDQHVEEEERLDRLDDPV